MLVEQDRVSVWINDHETGRTFCTWFYFFLNLAYVGEFFIRLPVLIPSRIESKDVILNHALKEPYNVIADFHDQLVLVALSRKHTESDFFVKFF